MSELNDWIGRSRRSQAYLDPWPAAALHATLGLAGAAPESGDELPPLWSWLYFLDVVPTGELGEDGHPQKGGFMPPVELPRRMWAGSRVEFHAPLEVGRSYERVSTVTDISAKSGRTGRLCFVTVDHEIGDRDGVAVRERQTVVYREPPAPGAAPPAQSPAQAAEWRSAWSADQRLLFRYSALTFNTHRIHYDEPYAMGVEGYAGLVVHGPLQATLMVQLAREQCDSRLASFEFQGKQPLFAGQPFEVCGAPDGDEVALWVQRADGVTASGRARLAE